MANPRKYSKNPILEWLDEEEGQAPTRSRSARALSPYVKIPKAPAGKSRRPPVVPPPAKPEPALAREPGGPALPAARQSQPASFDHLLKLSRLPRLRAPYDYKPSPQPSPPAAIRKPLPPRSTPVRAKR